jgi:hypothetical protein
MNRQEIREEIRRIIKDTDTNTSRQRWSDTILNTRINASQGKIAAITMCLSKRVSPDVSIVANTQEYALDSKFLAEIAVQMLDSNSQWVRLSKTSEEELDNKNANWRGINGTPGSYYIARGYIGLSPYPDFSRTTALRMDIYCRPDDLSTDTGSTGTPFNNKDLLTDFHDTIVLDVARRCKISEGLKDDAKLLLDEFDNRIRDMKSVLNMDLSNARMINIYESARVSSRRTY